MKKIFIRFVIFALLIALNAVAATFGGAVGCGGGDESSPLEPNISNGDEVAITTFDGTDPYLNVNEFVGDTFKDKDPDYQWLVETKEKLDSMLAGQYLSESEYNEIVQRQTEIQYKFDTLHDYYQQLEESHSANIDPHTAVEFALESYCLNLALHAPTSGSVYDEVVPMEEHIKKLFEWYYSRTKDIEGITFQSFIWNIQNFVHNGDSYATAFDETSETYLIEAFGNDAKNYLEQMRAKYGAVSTETPESGKSLSLANKSALYLAKLENIQTSSLAKETNDDTAGKGYFNLGNGLIGRFLSKTGFGVARLEVINNTDKPLEFKPFNFMLKQQGKSDYQPIGLGARRSSSYLSETEKKNQSINPAKKLDKKPTCNMTEAHRDRIIDLALPENWEQTPYRENSSKDEGVVCNQYVRIVYAEASLDFPDTITYNLPSSPFFGEIDKKEARDGDVILWLKKDISKNIYTVHHMGIWVENPMDHGGDVSAPILSAREHDGKSKKLSEDPNFVQTVDWTTPIIEKTKTDYRIFRFKGAGQGAPDCPVK